MPKVLLIFPSALYAPKWGRSYTLKPHLFHLYSFLKFYGIDVQVLDLEIEIGRPESETSIADFYDRVKASILQYDFDIVGISCWTSLNYLSTIGIAAICKDIKKNINVVVGGYHPSIMPSDFIYPGAPFDYIVIGEGELAFLAICNGTINAASKPQLIQGTPLDLTNDIPLEWQDYKYAIPNNRCCLYLSRGCPFSCSFCIEKKLRHSGWRSYPVRVAIDKIARLQQILTPTSIRITDACFGVDKTWRKHFFQGLAKIKSNNTIFWAESRIELIDKDDIDCLSRLNFEINFGIESCSPRMLKILKKTNKPQAYLEKLKEVFHYLNQKEVVYNLYFIFNHPGETYESYQETMAFLRSMVAGEKTISGAVLFQNFFYSPGSEVQLNLEHYKKKYGTIIKYENWWKMASDHHKLATAVIPGADLATKVSSLKYWFKDIMEIRNEMISRYPERTKMIRSLDEQSLLHHRSAILSLFRQFLLAFYVFFTFIKMIFLLSIGL